MNDEQTKKLIEAQCFISSLVRSEKPNYEVCIELSKFIEEKIKLTAPERKDDTTKFITNLCEGEKKSIFEDQHYISTEVNELEGEIKTYLSNNSLTDSKSWLLHKIDEFKETLHDPEISDYHLSNFLDIGITKLEIELSKVNWALSLNLEENVIVLNKIGWKGKLRHLRSIFNLLIDGGYVDTSVSRIPSTVREHFLIEKEGKWEEIDTKGFSNSARNMDTPHQGDLELFNQSLNFFILFNHKTSKLKLNKKDSEHVENAFKGVKIIFDKLLKSFSSQSTK